MMLKRTALAAAVAALASTPADAQFVYRHGHRAVGGPVAVAPDLAPPGDLTLAHAANARQLAVSWSAGVGNGGCKVQYRKGGGPWLDLPGAAFDCDAARPPTALGLPSDGWGAWSAVSFRLASATGAPVAAFASQATCAARPGSDGPTPGLDENCNGMWDDTSTTTETFGGCPSGQTCLSVCNSYGAYDTGCQSTGSYCAQGSASNAYFYSWVDGYTHAYRPIPYASTDGNLHTTARPGSGCSHAQVTGVAYH